MVLSKRKFPHALYDTVFLECYLHIDHGQIFEDEDVENTELKAAENFLKKKLGSSISLEEELPYEERQKLFASAFRKGFRQDSIKKAYNNLMDNA